MLNAHQQRVWGDEPGGHKATGFYADARQFAHDSWANVFPDKVYMSPDAFTGNAASGNDEPVGTSKWAAPTPASLFPKGVLMKSVEPLEDYDTSEMLPLPNAVAPSTNEIMLALMRRNRRHQERQQELHMIQEEQQQTSDVQQPETKPDPQPNQAAGAEKDIATATLPAEPALTDSSSDCQDDSQGQRAAPEAALQTAAEAEPEETRLVLPALESLMAMRQKRLNPKPEPSSTSKPQPPLQRSGTNSDRNGWDGAAKGARAPPVRRVVVVATYTAPRASATADPVTTDGPGPGPGPGPAASSPSFSAARAPSYTSPSGPPLTQFSSLGRASRKWASVLTDSIPAANNPSVASTTAATNGTNTNPGTAALASAPSASVSIRLPPQARSPGPSWGGNEQGVPSSGQPRGGNMALSRSFTFGHKQAGGPPMMPPQGPARAAAGGQGPGSVLPGAQASASVPEIGQGAGLGMVPEEVVRMSPVVRTSRASPSSSEGFSSNPGVSGAAEMGSPAHGAHRPQQRLFQEQWQQLRLEQRPDGGGGGYDNDGDDEDEDEDEDEDDDEEGDEDEDEDEEGDGNGELYYTGRRSAAPAGVAAAAGGGRGGKGRSGYRSHEKDKASWRRARRITQSLDVASMDMVSGQGQSPYSAPSSSTSPLHGISPLGQGPGRGHVTALTAPQTIPTGPLSPMASRRGAPSGGAGPGPAGGATGDATKRPGGGAMALPTWLDKALGRSNKRAGGGGAGGKAGGGDDAVSVPGAEVNSRAPSLSTPPDLIATSPAPGSSSGGVGGFTSKFKNFKNRLHGFSSTPASPSGEGPGSPALSPTALGPAGGPRARPTGSNDGRSIFAGSPPGSFPGGGGGATAATGQGRAAGGGAAVAELPAYIRPSARSSVDSALRPAPQPQVLQPQTPQPALSGMAMRTSSRTVPGTSAGVQNRGRFPTADAPAGSSASPFTQQAGPLDPQQMMVVSSSVDRRRLDATGGWTAVSPVQLPPVRLL